MTNDTEHAPALSPEHLDTFRGILKDAGPSGAQVADALYAADLKGMAGHAYGHAAQAISRISQAAAPLANHRLLGVAALLLHLPQVVAELRPPGTVMRFYLAELRKIEAHVLHQADGAYPSDTDDAFIKDVRFALGLSIPCGAQSVEVDDILRLRSLVKHALFTRDPRPLARLGPEAIGTTWFGIHTDSRDLGEFNEAGWMACYRRIGELLQQRPSVRGVVGTSWFFDPQIHSVSPRLGYLQAIPLNNGALAIRNGPGPVHTQRATATSDTRRKLFEDGQYLPVCYTIAWPRSALLAWCADRSADTR